MPALATALTAQASPALDPTSAAAGILAAMGAPLTAEWDDRIIGYTFAVTRSGARLYVPLASAGPLPIGADVYAWSPSWQLLPAVSLWPAPSDPVATAAPGFPVGAYAGGVLVVNPSDPSSPLLVNPMPPPSGSPSVPVATLGAGTVPGSSAIPTTVPASSAPAPEGTAAESTTAQVRAMLQALGAPANLAWLPQIVGFLGPVQAFGGSFYYPTNAQGVPLVDAGGNYVYWDKTGNLVSLPSIGNVRSLATAYAALVTTVTPPPAIQQNTPPAPVAIAAPAVPAVITPASGNGPASVAVPDAAGYYLQNGVMYNGAGQVIDQMTGHVLLDSNGAPVLLSDYLAPQNVPMNAPASVSTPAASVDTALAPTGAVAPSTAPAGSADALTAQAPTPAASLLGAVLPATAGISGGLVAVVVFILLALMV